MVMNYKGENKMTNYEIIIIRKIVNHIKELQETKSKEDVIRFIDNSIIMRKYLNHSDEFIQKLYLIRYYINLGKKI